MPERESVAGRLNADDGPVSVAELIDRLAAFEASSLCADEAVSFLLLLDHLRAQLCAAHHDTFRELLGPSEPLIEQDLPVACPLLEAELF